MRKDDELFVIMDEVNLGYEEEEEDLEPEMDQLKAGPDELKADLEVKVITLRLGINLRLNEIIGRLH